ncbi:NAD(P)/FAD-dependent oxidoreductase [Agrococcus citreus]|uniref:FAD dependent oxidoreductase domain-containing protein n=1 Tax=Agrococcus citreus TaxID=84643 RepID=A0ABN1YR63_9MICO
MVAEGGRLLVVGGGVLGLAVAAAAAEDGWRVTLLEREDALCTVASGTSLAWANALAKRPASYAALSREGIKRHAAGSAAATEPWFTPMPADVRGVTVTEGGIVDVAAFARAHAGAIRDRGGIVRVGASVARIEADATGAVAVLGTGERVGADRVVLAAGVGTPALLRGHGALAPIDVVGPIGAIARVRAPASWSAGLTVGDELSARPSGAGELLLQSASLEEAIRDGSLPLDERACWRRLRAIASRHGLALEDDDLQGFGFAHRPQPVDGLPIAGWATDRLYVVVAHSGVTLAPVLGCLVAAELGGERQIELQGLRPPGSVPNDSDEEHIHGH